MPTVAELRLQAKEKGIRGYSRMRKAELEKALSSELTPEALYSESTPEALCSESTPEAAEKCEIKEEEECVVRMRRKGGVVVQDGWYIGRRINMGGWNLTESKYHNPFTIKNSGSREEALKKFEEYLLNNKELMKDIKELKGKSLGCWCYDSRKEKKDGYYCHGDILLHYANKE